MTTLRVLALILCGVNVVGQSRMIGIYTGIFRSPVSDGWQPALLRTAGFSAMKWLGWGVVALLADWPKAIPWLLIVRFAISVVDFSTTGIVFAPRSLGPAFDRGMLWAKLTSTAIYFGLCVVALGVLG